MTNTHFKIIRLDTGETVFTHWSESEVFDEIQRLKKEHKFSFEVKKITDIMTFKTEADIEKEKKEYEEFLKERNNVK